MKSLVLYFSIFIILISCKEVNDKRALETFFHQEEFDAQVMQNLNVYDSIKDLGVLYIETLFKFRDSLNVANGQSTENMYDFYYQPMTKEFVDNDRNYTVPVTLAPKFMRLFEQLAHQNTGFTLLNDSSFEIPVGGFYDQKTDFESGHKLVWKQKYQWNPDDLIKDTVIAPGWTYYISVDRRHRD